jgi:hypothetical protein
MDNMKQIIRLTESDIHRLVKEAVNKILSEELGPGSPGSGFAGGSSTPVGANNAQISSTAAYDRPVNDENNDDFWDGSTSRPKGDIAMNKSEQPVGHDGRLKEGYIRRIVKESVKNILKELREPLDLTSDYNLFLNGDASYMNGKFDVCDGYYHVEINTSLSYISIEGENGEDYFLQGDEADELITQICKYWINNDCTQDEAIEKIINGLF